MNDEHPKGWAITTLGQICSKPQYGWTCTAAKNGKIKYLRTSDISEGQIDWQRVPYCEEVPDDVEKYRVYPDDILVARAGSVGVSHRVQDTVHDAVFASYLIRFNALDGIEPKFIEFFLRSHEYWQAISDFTAGIAIPNVNATKLASLELPLASLNEQHRIVAKLEMLLDKVEACHQRLEKIPIILKRFRQSVLAAACSGRLTADWRDENPHAAVKAADPPEGAPETPESWRWNRLNEVAHVRGGVTKGRKMTGKKTIMLPYLRVANVQDGYLDLSEMKQIEVLPEDEGKYRLESGDVLFTEGGDRDKLGRGAVWRGEIPKCIHQNHIFRARLFTPQVTPEYVSLVTKSEFSRHYFFDNASQTVNLASINLTTLLALPIPIPPVEEQNEIIRRLEALSKLADQIEVRFTKAKVRVDQITQSLLAKAFRGELVPQDPNDEPASVLLERIKTERAKREVEVTGKQKERKIKSS